MLFVQKQLLQAIDIYTDMGRFTIAAKHHETIAGIFESEVNFCIQLHFQIQITKLFSKQNFSVCWPWQSNAALRAGGKNQ